MEARRLNRVYLPGNNNEKVDDLEQVIEWDEEIAEAALDAAGTDSGSGSGGGTGTGVFANGLTED